MSEARLNIVKSRDIPKPTYYVGALTGEFAHVAYDEERAPAFKGKWREEAFGVAETHPLDLEIGTGNGYFFAHRAVGNSERSLLGIEVKFKPLIQSIRRALNSGCKNARVLRYDASLVDHLFADGELNHVFIHHPDPWERRSQWKHRLMKAEFLNTLYGKQKSGHFLEFKTDSRDYFFWAAEQFKKTPYQIERYTEDLHHAPWSHENFITHFERIFLRKGQPIYYLRALKPELS